MPFGPVVNFMFSAVPVMVITIFIIVTIGFIFAAISMIKQSIANNNSPEVTVPAKLVAKRTHVWGGAGDSSAHTSYYLTFEFENGERHEFSVGDNVYAMNAEGDYGMLTHKGTRFLKFERELI